MTLFLYLLVMAGVTYLIRVIPFTVFRRKIKSKFLRSLLFYIPYAVLAAMTFPAILTCTGNPVSSITGTIVALGFAFFNMPLIVVAVAAAVAAFLTGLLF